MSDPAVAPGSVSNPPADENPLTLESLIAECQDIGDRIVTLAGSIDRVAAAALVLLGITGSVVLATDRLYLLMLLPTAVWSVALYHTFVTNDIKSLGAYKLVLEKEVNRRLGFPVIVWESTVVRLGRYNRIYLILYFIVFGLAFGLSAWIALVQACATNSTWYVRGTIASIFLGVCAVGTGAVLAEVNAWRTKKEVSEAYRSPDLRKIARSVDLIAISSGAVLVKESKTLKDLIDDKGTDDYAFFMFVAILGQLIALTPDKQDKMTLIKEAAAIHMDFGAAYEDLANRITANSSLDIRAVVAPWVFWNISGKRPEGDKETTKLLNILGSYIEVVVERHLVATANFNQH
jgi:hypothetical protein